MKKNKIISAIISTIKEYPLPAIMMSFFVIIYVLTISQIPKGSSIYIFIFLPILASIVLSLFLLFIHSIFDILDVYEMIDTFIYYLKRKEN